MKRKIQFRSHFESEYHEFKEYPPMRRDHNFHTEEHFVVPWELEHSEEKCIAKAKAWE